MSPCTLNHLSIILGNLHTNHHSIILGNLHINHLSTLQYFILVVLIFICEIVATVMLFVYRNEVQHVVSEELLKGIKYKYPPADQHEDPDGLRDIWAFVQSNVSVSVSMWVCVWDLLCVLFKNKIIFILMGFCKTKQTVIWR